MKVKPKIVRGLSYSAPAEDRQDLPLEKRRVLDLVGEGKAVLEVGCSSGAFTRHLGALGCRVTAVELDPRAAVEARRFAASVVVGDIEDPGTLSEVVGQFDVILFMHVLEHLVDPWRVLRETRALLVPGGCVIILLPNVASWAVRRALLFAGAFRYQEYGVLDITHLRFFTLASAQEMIQSCGLKLLHYEVVGWTVPLAGLMTRTLLLRGLVRHWERLMVRLYPNLCGSVLLFRAS